MLNVFKNMRKETRVMTIVTIAIVVMVGVMMLLLPRIRYNKAMEMISENKLVEAREIFINLGDYKDAREQLPALSIRLVYEYIEKDECYDALVVIYWFKMEGMEEYLNEEFNYYCRMFEYYRDENYEEALEILYKWMRQLSSKEERDRSIKFEEMIKKAMGVNTQDSSNEK